MIEKCEGKIVWGVNSDKCRMSHDAALLARSFGLMAQISNWSPAFAYEYLLGLASRAELEALEANGRSSVCRLGAQEVRDVAEKFADDQQIPSSCRNSIRLRTDHNLQVALRQKNR